MANTISTYELVTNSLKRELLSSKPNLTVEQCLKHIQKCVDMMKPFGKVDWLERFKKEMNIK